MWPPKIWWTSCTKFHQHSNIFQNNSISKEFLDKLKRNRNLSICWRLFFEYLQKMFWHWCKVIIKLLHKHFNFPVDPCCLSLNNLLFLKKLLMTCQKKVALTCSSKICRIHIFGNTVKIFCHCLLARVSPQICEYWQLITSTFTNWIRLGFPGR